MERLLEHYRFRDALKEAMNLARIGNKYLADMEPWKLAKTDMERVAAIMHLSLQLTANLAIAFEPFLPFTAEKLRNMIGLKVWEWNALGNFNLLPEGHLLGEPSLLFEKIEDEQVEQQIQKLLVTKKANETAAYQAKPVKENVAFEDFMKMDIRVGTVLDCQRVPKADKLLQFRIADGLKERTILSGIAQYYPDPQALIGMQVCFVANFEPKKLRGIMSEGMILSAEDADGKLVIIQPSAKVTNGVEVK
jgi:methionyl-tRNA synthetase